MPNCKQCGRCCKGFTMVHRHQGGLLYDGMKIDGVVLSKENVLEVCRKQNDWGDLFVNSLTVALGEEAPHYFHFTCSLQTPEGLCSIQETKPELCASFYCAELKEVSV